MPDRSKNKKNQTNNKEPEEHTSKEVASNKDPQREFEYLFRLFELYTNVQVQADTIYFNRTSIITLTEGLLLLAYQSLAQKGTENLKLLSYGIASIGLVLSILWLFFEQRNEIYFLGRGEILKNLEHELIERIGPAKAAFKSFWLEVPRWVKVKARWYQRFSAPLILRVLVPLLFIISWLIIIATNNRIYNNAEAVPAAALPQTMSTPNSGSQVLPVKESSTGSSQQNSEQSISPKNQNNSPASNKSSTSSNSLSSQRPRSKR